MNIAILGYGKEGQSVQKYFSAPDNEIAVFDNFSKDDLEKIDLSNYDLVMRSPSVPPLGEWSSITKYFFDRCPCPIIGVTGTKGKGTTCSIVAALLKNLGQNVYLVGNIGIPALDILDELTPNDVVVYELSSFQLWDLEKSPHVAAILRIEPDHLNVHYDYADYINAKANIAKHQQSDDYLIYHLNSPDTVRIAERSSSHCLGYPHATAELNEIISHLAVPGKHNQENAEAALLIVASYLNVSIDGLIKKYRDTIIDTFENFRGLPHRIQFIRKLNGVEYYDDNFSSAFPALEVAIAAFSEQPIFLIAGGFDRGLDHTPAQKCIFSTPNIQKTFLIGQTSTKLAANQNPEKYQLCTTLSEAINAARIAAESEVKKTGKTAIVLMSPGAPSFDMFKNFTDRGLQFQKLVQEL